jgi:hypothetical protein
MLGCQRPQYVAASHGAGRQSKHHEVGLPGLERVVQLSQLHALVNGKAELAQNFAQELADVVLAVRHADKWRVPSTVSLVHGPLRP